MKKLVLLGALLGAMSAQSAEVMTWVPAYSINQSYEMLNKDFGGVGMKDGLTRLALQWWQPTLSGGLEKDKMYRVITDADIKKFADWGDANNIEVQLCIYNPPLAEGQHWNWPQAQAAINNPKVFVSAVIAEIERLAAAGISIDGVDMDLESSTSQSAKDQKKYLAMMKQLSVALKAKGKKLTAATYAAKFNAPNIHYWPKLTPFIDGITPMAYENSGYEVTCEKMWDHPADWCTYQTQIKLTSPLDRRKLTLGTPGNVNYGGLAQKWMGKSNIEHLQGIKDLGAGLAIWDAVLHPSWQTAEVWNIIKDIKSADSNASLHRASAANNKN